MKCLEVDGCSSVDGLQRQHNCLDSDAGRVLDTLQWFSHRGQEGVSVVQAGDDQSLDQELRCLLCEERSDPADVVEDKSAGSGHSSDVGGAGQSRITPRFLSRRRRYCDVLDSD